MQLHSLLLSLSLAAGVLAFPPQPYIQKRQDSPLVLYPDAGVTWIIGSVHNVTWNPAGQTSTDGVIFLAKQSFANPEPLASGVDTSVGRIEITVPDVEPSTDYNIIMVIGGMIVGPSSGSFTIAQSPDDLPASVSANPSEATTIVFPGTTIVATPPFTTTAIPSAFDSITSSIASSLASEASEAASSISEELSSIASSIESAQSSASDALSDAASSASSAVSSLTDAADGAEETEGAEEGAAVSLAPGACLGMVSVLMIAISAGAMVL